MVIDTFSGIYAMNLISLSTLCVPLIKVGDRFLLLNFEILEAALL